MSVTGTRSRWANWVLAAMLVGFLGLRGPLMFRQPGGQDEDWFAIPGWTVAREGIPRVPYAPSRDPKGAFYKADQALFALPPAYFYWQAPLYWILPAGYGTSRLASGIAGLIAVWLVYRLGVAFYQDHVAALWAAGLYSLSRVFYFPAMFARPDMLCGMFGLAAVLMAWRWQQARRWRDLTASGLLLGLGMLTHPFAIAFCLQVGLWVLIGGRGWRRFLAAGVLTGCALLAFSLWLPLILAYPDIFEVQFRNNVLDRSGPGLLIRFVLPWQYIVYQSRLLLEHAGVLQTALMALGLLIATLFDWRRTEPGPRTALGLAWSGLYLLAVCQGEHPTKGYWCYTGALVFVCVGRAVAELGRGICGSWPRVVQSFVTLAGGVLLVAAMIPGSGIRTWVAHLRHWNDVAYNSPRFVRELLETIPPNARLLVDPAYVCDAYLAGRPTILAVTDRFYFQATDFPYDVLIAGPYCLRAGIPDQLNGTFVRAAGVPDDPFACYAEIYVPRRAE